MYMKYMLNTNELPQIESFHDERVKEFRWEEGFLKIVFDHKVMKIHLMPLDFTVYLYSRKRKRLNEISKVEFVRNYKPYSMEYLYLYERYCGLTIEFDKGIMIIVCDYVEVE